MLDYGQAIRDLAAANIFPGDLLLKNFGVTRHGRVVFYDYDELCLLTDCRFRELPVPRGRGRGDERRALVLRGAERRLPRGVPHLPGPAGELREAFLAAHGEILTPGFWRRMQRQIGEGELVDIFPYAASRRLPG